MNPKLIKQNLEELKIELIKVYNNEIKEIEIFSKQYLTAQLSVTLRFKNSSRLPFRERSGFATAKPKVKFKEIKQSTGIFKLEARAFMSNSGTDAPHVVWNIINSGRKSYTARKLTKFPTLIAPRTAMGTLGVLPFQGWGKWVTIPAGGVIGGFEGRDWYKTITGNLTKELSKKFPDWQFKISYDDKF